MNEPVVILDPSDPDTFHTDPTCPDLLPLLERAEARLGHAIDDPSVLLDQAFSEGLLLLDGVAAGLRWCRACRAAHQAATVARRGLAA
jgi:hypothetical protein